MIQLLNRIPAQIVDTFEVGAAALLLAEKQKVYRSGPVMPALDLESLKAVVAREEPVIDAANSLCFVPVRMGVRPIGSLGISGTILSRQTLEAIGTLIAVAMERARAVEQLGQTEAAHEGERLRTALLDSVTHALRTPLTSIKAAVTNLLSNPATDQCTTSGASDNHQRGERPLESPGGRSGRDGAARCRRSGTETRGASPDRKLFQPRSRTEDYSRQPALLSCAFPPICRSFELIWRGFAKRSST